MERIAFIGAGNLADSLVGGLIKCGYAPKDLNVFDIDSERMRKFVAKHKGVQSAASAAAAAEQCTLLILCVKPDAVHGACKSLTTGLPDGVAVVSVAAGITLSALARWFGQPQLALLRCMPNLSVSVGLGMSVLCANPAVSPAQRTSVEAVFQAVGEVSWVDDEALMDSVTALSGSGPAYFFYIVNVLEQAAVRQGLDRELAKKSALQTMLGAAVFARQSDETLERLCARVASKGGTTEAALAVFEQAGLDEILRSALDAAMRRAQEISRQTGDD